MIGPGNWVYGVLRLVFIFYCVFLTSFLSGCVSVASNVNSGEELQKESWQIYNSIQNHLPENLRPILPNLREREFESVDKLIRDLQDQHISNPTNEMPLDLALDIIHKTEIDIERELTEFVNQFPDSYVSFLLRGVYYTNLGWKARGLAFYEQTPKKQINEMNYYFGKALKDLDKAITLNASLVHAYCYKLDILMNYLSRRAEAEDALALALKVNPLSYKARYYFLSLLEPKWGGSLEQMEQFINEAQVYAPQNPDLTGLRGRINTTLGEQAHWDKKNKKAIEHFLLAAETGKGIYVEYELAYIGRILYSQKKYKQAYDYFKKAVEIRPSKPKAHRFLLKLEKTINH